MNDNADIGRARILYIDDDNELIAIYTRFFEHSEYEFKTALTAEEGIEAIGLFQPDLIISDVILPGMNGVDFCRKLREDESLKDTIIMLVTGMEVESEDLVEGFTAGADEYLMKPFSKDEILARVHALLRTKRLKNELASMKVALEEAVIENRRLRDELKACRTASAGCGKNVEMKLYEIKPGMKLAEGMCTVKGGEFLSENTVLTAENIHQISLYKKEDLLKDTVMIKE